MVCDIVFGHHGGMYDVCGEKWGEGEEGKGREEKRREEKGREGKARKGRGAGVK